MSDFERGEAYFKLRNYNKAIEYFNELCKCINWIEKLNLHPLYHL